MDPDSEIFFYKGKLKKFRLVQEFLQYFLNKIRI